MEKTVCEYNQFDWLIALIPNVGLIKLWLNYCNEAEVDVIYYVYPVWGRHYIDKLLL